MEILIVLSALSGIYFWIRTVMLSKKLDEIRIALATELVNTYSNNDETKDNFLKFVSDSREWAFDYIEDVQNSLKEFIDTIEEDVNHYDQYGAAIEGHCLPYDVAMKKMVVELPKLKKLLPEESKND